MKKFKYIVGYGVLCLALAGSVVYASAQYVGHKTQVDPPVISSGVSGNKPVVATVETKASSPTTSSTSRATPKTTSQSKTVPPSTSTVPQSSPTSFQSPNFVEPETKVADFVCPESTILATKSYLSTLMTTSISSISLQMDGYSHNHPDQAWGNPEWDSYYAQLVAFKNKNITLELERLNDRNAQYNCSPLPNTYLISVPN